jgi:hypothetical protein
LTAHTPVTKLPPLHVYVSPDPNARMARRVHDTPHTPQKMQRKDGAVDAFIRNGKGLPVTTK